MEKYLVLATFVGSVIALLFAFFTGKRVLSFDEGTPLMSKISRSIREGANAYLKRQYTVVGIFFACMIVLIPIVYACFGTSSADAKNLLFASIVLSVRSTQCVSFSNASPGSLKPICPLCPSPSS